MNEDMMYMGPDENIEEQPKKRKRNVAKIIFNVVFTLVAIAIFANAVIGVINFNRISNDLEPVIFTKMNEKSEGSRKIKTYHQGIFDIVVEEKYKETLLESKRWTFRPSFIK